MKISIRDFAPIKEADIALDGLTVIAGDNDTGKSTVGKILFAQIKAAGRAKATNANDHDKKVLLRTHLNLVFGRDSRQGNSSISSSNNDLLLEARIGRSGEVEHFTFSDLLPYSDALFIDTPVFWQLFNTFIGISAYNDDPGAINAPKITYPYSLFNAYKLLGSGTLGAERTHQEGLDAIRHAIGGKLEFSNGQPIFTRDGEAYPIQSVATGIQAFVIIQRLLELGLAEPKRLLILDEPEVHMHPKWQLEYAKLLVSMVDELGMNVLMTTHSPVFVEAMEFVGRKKLGEKCHFYLSERTADGPVVMRDVTDDPEPIYKQLALPLMQLSLHQGDA